MNDGTLSLVSVVVGALIAAVPTWLMERGRLAREVSGAARAISGEVQATIDVMRARRYLEAIQGYIDMAQQGKVFVMRVRIKEEYFALTKLNMRHIGAFDGKLPNLIPQIISYASAGMEDMHRMYDDPHALKDHSPASAVIHYTELHNVFSNFIRIGELIVQEVEAFYPTKSSRRR